MKLFSKRLLALLVVLAMTATGLTALAEAPKLPTANDVYVRGNTLKTEIDVQLESETISGLLAMFSGGQQDPSQTAIVTTAVNAITKLTTTILSTTEDATVTVGTDAGTLLTIQGKVEGENAVAAFDLLPGIQLKLPQEMMQSLAQSQAAMKAPEVAEEAVVPYVTAINTYFSEKVLSAAQVEEGAFEVANVGTFSTKTTYNLTNGIIAGLITSLNDVFRADTEMQAVVDQYLTSMNTANQASEAAAPEGAIVMQTTPKTAADLIKTLDEMAAEANKAGDTVVAEQRLYNNKDSEAFYMETETPAGESDQTLMTVASLGEGMNTDIRVELLVNTAAPSYGEPEAEAAPAATEEAAAPTDWVALKAAVLDGTNPMATLVNFNVNAGPEADGANVLSKMDMTIRTQGMQFALNMDGKTATQGDFASEGKVQLTALTPSPLLTVVYKLSEVTDKPAPLADAEKVIVMNDENLSEEDNAAMGEALQKGLPLLMERLQTVLPEEGPVLVQLIQQMMAPPAPANPS